MSHFRNSGRIAWRLMTLAGLVLVSVIPVQTWVSAQNPSAPPWVVRTIDTSEFGAAEPGGLAFSSPTSTFVVLGTDGTGTLITTTEKNTGTTVLPEAKDNALNAAFDASKNSLFVLDQGKGEIAEIKSDAKGLPDPAAARLHSAIRAFGIKDPQGITFSPQDGRLFILDAGKSQILAVAPHPTLGFDANEALRSNKIERISLKDLGTGPFRGIALNPGNGHLYISQPEQKRLYELTQTGELVSTVDLAPLEVNNPTAMTFAPSGDTTDDPNTSSLYILDSGKTAASDSQIVELSLVAAAALPSGTTLVPTSLVHVIDTSKAAWNPSAPDATGIDYWPPTGNLLIADSEVEEMPAYWQGSNVFQSTLSGTLVSTCSTRAFTREPTGLAVNSTNRHIFFSDDGDDLIYEVNVGNDNTYCTADDTVTQTRLFDLYGISDAEDVAYGNNTIFVADGASAEVYIIPLGNNHVLGGGDDGPVTHFDTSRYGFNILEGLGYNADNGTLLLVSTKAADKYVGETTPSGELLRAYDLSLPDYNGLTHREDVTFAPGSQNPAIKSLYITDRGVDNNQDPNENDGEVYEIRIGGSPTNTSTPGPSTTPTNTRTPTVPPTITNTPVLTDLIFADGFESGNFSAWTSNTNDGGDLSVTSAAALADTRGMQALLDDNTAIFVTDDTPNAEARYRARFYFDPNSVSMSSGAAHFLFRGFLGSSTQVVRVEFRFSSGNYQIRAALTNDGSTWTNTNWFTISDDSHAIEFDWQAATGAGANNGSLTLWIDGIQQASLTGIDNDTRRVDRVRLGAVAGLDAGTSGTYFFDAFESRRESYIGP